MQARRLILTGLALSLAFTAPRLRATTVEPPTFDALVNRSDYVVRAVVKSATPEWKEADGKPYISTHFELDVSEEVVDRITDTANLGWRWRVLREQVVGERPGADLE